MLSLDIFNLEPQFIKIDAEGCELRILCGAACTISRNKPIMVIEVNHEALAAQGHTFKNLIEFVEEIGYSWTRIYGTDEIHDLLLKPR